MRTRRIAVAGLTDDVSQAFRSMLKILDGRGGLSWVLVSPDEAEVLIAGTHGDDLAARRWATKTDKPMIAVYEGAAARPMTPYTLHHPFRVMQLLGVLDDVDQALAGSAHEPLRARAVGGGVDFAESLRLLARSSAAGNLHAAGEGAARVFVRDDLSVYYASEDTVRRLTRAALPLPALHLTGDAPPSGFICRPVFELAWFTGWHATDALAPWVDRNASYRLRRWPDFGLLRGTREQLALAALLTNASYSRARLLELSRQAASNVDRFLNACALAGVLAATADGALAAESGTGTFLSHSAARLGGLIRGLRSRLGLTNSA
jgi:hypothetical protein